MAVPLGPVVTRHIRLGFHRHKENGFGTPTKKVHLYREDLEGIDQALPRPILAPEYEADVDDCPFFTISNQ